jgi:hypothetical protein
MFVKFTTLTSGKLACHTGCRSLSRYVPMTSRVSGFQELSSMVDGATSTGQARPGCRILVKNYWKVHARDWHQHLM